MNRRLEAEGLVVCHGRTRALDDLSFGLAKGELVGLLGPNGSGKSTLLRVLLGAQGFDCGTVRLDGRPLASMSTRERARALTIVAHSRVPDFALRVRDVVELGRIPHEGLFGASNRADETAVELALDETDTLCLSDRPLGTLSSGELQRVHLARAFAQGASILLLDEPTANLDPHHQLAAMQLLRGFVDRGGAALVVLHDLTLAGRSCDRLIILEAGRLRVDAPPSEALAEEFLADVFRVRSRVRRNAAGKIDYVLALEPIDRRVQKQKER